MTSSAILYLKILYPIDTWGLPPRLGPGPPPSKASAGHSYKAYFLNHTFTFAQ